jgi:predicted transcriptional regulator
MNSKKPASTRKERRSKLDIYFAILSAIQEETDEGAKPTKIQYKSGMSYDKVIRHLEILQEKKLIIKKQYYHLTEKGIKFLAEYSMVNDFIDKMEL